jgi:beta-lactamase regulating signal transducer with metallopeptidase domain
MNDALSLAMHNTLAAAVLALCVYGLTRFRPFPPLAHALWLLVLLKLVSPPVLALDWSACLPSGSASALDHFLSDASTTEHETPDALSDSLASPMPQTGATGQAVSAPAIATGPVRRLDWNLTATILLGLWLGGAALSAVIAAIRIVRFEQRLQGTLPLPERWQHLVQDVADKLGVRRLPAICCVECEMSPFLWSAGRRPVIVVPRRLLSQLDDEAAAMILAPNWPI